MPVIIFVLMYITGILLAFVKQSNLKGLYIYGLFRVVLFFKIKKQKVFIQTLVFQIMNLLFFIIIMVLYFILSEKIISEVYNIYKWASLIMFVMVLAVTAADAAVIEKRGAGNNENH